MAGDLRLYSRPPPFIGPIPAAIPLLWASLGYFCLLAGGNYAVSALLMMLLDVAFDPKFSRTLWNWVPPGAYFGVPLANFVGWFSTALVIFVLYRLLSKNRFTPSPRPVAFYLLIGVFIGAVPDFVPDLYGAGEVALAMFAVAGLLLYLLARHTGGKDRKPAPASESPARSSPRLSFRTAIGPTAYALARFHKKGAGETEKPNSSLIEAPTAS